LPSRKGRSSVARAVQGGLGRRAAAVHEPQLRGRGVPPGAFRLAGDEIGVPLLGRVRGRRGCGRADLEAELRRRVAGVRSGRTPPAAAQFRRPLIPLAHHLHTGDISHLVESHGSRIPAISNPWPCPRRRPASAPAPAWGWPKLHLPGRHELANSLRRRASLLEMWRISQRSASGVRGWAGVSGRPSSGNVSARQVPLADVGGSGRLPAKDGVAGLLVGHVVQHRLDAADQFGPGRRGRRSRVSASASKGRPSVDGLGPFGRPFRSRPAAGAPRPPWARPPRPLTTSARRGRRAPP